MKSIYVIQHIRAIRDEIHADIMASYRPKTAKDFINSKKRDVLNDRLAALDEVYSKLMLGIPLHDAETNNGD